MTLISDVHMLRQQYKTSNQSSYRQIRSQLIHQVGKIYEQTRGSSLLSQKYYKHGLCDNYII